MATWLADDATEPDISPQQKQQLQATAKTVKPDDPKTEFETKPLSPPLLQGQITIVLALIGTDISLPIHITGRVVIGRQSANWIEKADLDLTPYGGVDCGVSRLHAVLYRTRHTVSLADLGSTNGTYVNGVRLLAHQPQLMRDGDEVRFGNMRFHLSFDQPSK